MTKEQIIKLVGHSYAPNSHSVLELWDIKNDCPATGPTYDPLALILLKAASASYDPELDDQAQVNAVINEFCSIRQKIISCEMDMIATYEMITDVNKNLKPDPRPKLGLGLVVEHVAGGKH